MIQSKNVNIIIAVAVVFALIVSAVLVTAGRKLGESGGTKTEPEYATRIFGTDIISIEIFADETQWRNMLDNAMSEQFIMADVVVNGVKFQNIGIRPKGNSSLSQVANSNSDRYSFRLQFDEYIDGQTCFGLESFVLNNMLGDNTYMKEYISYDLMREAGVDAPYFGFAYIKVNGENWGLYLAVELYNDSYEQRVFGDTSGMLYNVKSMDIGWNRGEQQEGAIPAMPDWRPPEISDRQVPSDMPGRQFFPAMPGRQDPNVSDRPDFPFFPDSQNFPAMPEGWDPETMPEGRNPGLMPDWQNNLPQGPFGRNNDGENTLRGNIGRRGGSGGSLEYIDDNSDSYRAIFNNVVGKGTERDFKRVVKAIKALSEGNDLETYFDVDKILRYLAAHTYVVNLDSYSSGMAQNYYIYERNGQITILPWDYNLAWGGFQNSNTSSVINFPIDTPVSGVEMSSRPLIDKLLSNPEYRDRYHEYLRQLTDNYFANGKFDEKINKLDALISEYVKNDPTAFCTYDEYKTAVSAFMKLGNLRALSVQGQLDGTVPSTTDGQRKNPDKLIAAGDLNLSALGSMMGGREGNRNNAGFPGGFGGWPFGGNQQGDEQTDPPFNAGGMRQRRQNTNSRNDLAVWSPSSQRSEVNNLFVTGALTLVLIAAIIFASRYKKNY
ncbi:MAG TPA: spore coat protein CotH [Clostridiaceae bacterium]|nr:spore coat protein CotH [Clostridiaceae bacterium]